jgi:hypothetical protein
MGKQWFVRGREKVYGPFSSSKLKAFADSGKLTHNTPIALEANGPWHAAEKVRGLFSAPSVTPAPLGDLLATGAPESVAAPKKRGKKSKGAKKKARAAKAEAPLLVVVLDGVDAAGNPRVCEVRFRKKTMQLPRLQPNGQTWLVSVDEPYTAEVRRKTDAGKSAWYEFPSWGDTENHARQVAVEAASLIKWTAPSERKAPKQSMPGYREPPCDKCGKGIGKQAMFFRPPGGGDPLMYCSRCYGVMPWSFNQIEYLAPISSRLRLLPTPLTPPSRCNEGVCGKCLSSIVGQSYRFRWLPTNAIYVFCPKCWSKVSYHDGFESQIDYPWPQ